MRADEAALAISRVPHAGASGAVFPQPLQPADAALMRRIFAYQARGNIPEAIRSTSALEDPLLLGTALADRYLGHYHRSSFEELSDWLSRYPELPDAASIHALLLTRAPKGADLPPAPRTVILKRFTDTDTVPEDIDPPRNDLARDPVLDRSVLDHVQRGNTASALRLISSRRGISPAYAAQLRAEVAQQLFIRNEDVDALRVAQAALRDTAVTDQPSLAFYTGGLAAWRLDRIALARELFEGGAKASNTSARLHAASAFWASRASRSMRDAVGTVKWLRVAAEERLTLYGLLARRILHMDTGIFPSRELLSQADVDAVAATPQGRRAFALLQIGQADRAEAELRALWTDTEKSPVFGRSVLMVASAAGFTESAAQMAALLQSHDGQRHDELRFPMPRLRPAGGFTIDPTLVYAVTRIESNFNSRAVSPAGARGLMQIMPVTAQYITGDLFFEPERLHEPSANLEIGQRYLTYLSRQEGISNDLLRMLASYNSGPGGYLRWGPEIRDGGDPLLFLEAIPVAETRAFVSHALVYAWIYAARMHLPATSLDDLSAGEFPSFTPTGFTRSPQERRMASAAAGMH
jgi:soluble lytic murein transglycosylase